jgi:hypothetical protein
MAKDYPIHIMQCSCGNDVVFQRSNKYMTKCKKCDKAYMITCTFTHLSNKEYERLVNME